MKTQVIRCAKRETSRVTCRKHVLERALPAAVCACSAEPDIPEAARTGIIGSADGPIAVFIASPQNAAKSYMHRDVSSLYFETPEAIEWLMVFRKLPCEPIKKKLL